MSEIVNNTPAGAPNIYKKRVEINYGTIVTVVNEEGTAAFAEADAADGVVASPTAALPAGLAYGGARVSATGVVSIAIANLTAGTLTPNTLTFDVYLTKGSAAV
jgi:hypothetical protein